MKTQRSRKDKPPKKRQKFSSFVSNITEINESSIIEPFKRDWFNLIHSVNITVDHLYSSNENEKILIELNSLSKLIKTKINDIDNIETDDNNNNEILIDDDDEFNLDRMDSGINFEFNAFDENNNEISKIENVPDSSSSPSSSISDEKRDELIQKEVNKTAKIIKTIDNKYFSRCDDCNREFEAHPNRHTIAQRIYKHRLTRLHLTNVGIPMPPPEPKIRKPKNSKINNNNIDSNDIKSKIEDKKEKIQLANNIDYDDALSFPKNSKGEYSYSCLVCSFPFLPTDNNSLLEQRVLSHKNTLNHITNASLSLLGYGSITENKKCRVCRPKDKEYNRFGSHLNTKHYKAVSQYLQSKYGLTLDEMIKSAESKKYNEK